MSSIDLETNIPGTTIFRDENGKGVARLSADDSWMQAVDIAKVCHEANRAYCATLGDFSQPPWDDAPAWQRSSAVNRVEFKIANPTSTPKDSHDNWSREKIASGWVYGDVKDPDKKTHPCLVWYEELPLEQRRKDALFQAVVSALMSK